MAVLLSSAAFVVPLLVPAVGQPGFIVSEAQAARLLRERNWEVERAVDDFFSGGMVPEKVYVSLLAQSC